jgi:ketosteroid isomerase-like protein
MRPLFLLLALATLSCPVAAESKLTPALSALVEAERSFSRTAGERGVRDAFLEYFAADAIDFEPEPGPAIERIRTWPDPKRPGKLSWGPVFADISRAGDMGYTTGPTLSQDLGAEPRRPARHGYYFSVWRKQADGAWKVAIDAGITTPGEELPKTPLQTAAAPGYGNGKPEEAATARAALFELERKPGVDAEHLAEETRLHRDGQFPVLGREAVRADLATRAGPTRAEPADVIVATSADLAYSYGSFSRGPADGAPTERGYYVHVWKRAPDGAWQMVARIEQAAV